MLTLAAIDWTSVIVAAVVGLPATVSALAAVSVRRQITTPSKTRIGTQVEDVRHTALANHYYLRSAARELGATTPAPAKREAKQVAELEPDGEDA